MPIVASAQGRGIRWALEASEKELALYSPAERNRAIKTGLTAGGEVFLSVYIPLRFNTSYAYKLGYQIKNRWRRLKEKFLGRAIPYVGYTPPGGYGHNAEKMAVAVQKSHVRAVSHGALQELYIIIPIGHPIRDKETKSFHTVLPEELDRIGTEAARTIESILAGGTPKQAGKYRMTIEGATSRIPPHRKMKQAHARAIPTVSRYRRAS